MDETSHTPPSPERLQAFLDQILLRIFNASPGLSSYEESSRVSGDTVEVSFHAFPDEIIQSVEQAFSIKKLEVLRYTKNNHPCIGFRAYPTTDELSALAVNDGDKKHVALHNQEDGEHENTTDIESEANKMLEPPGQPDVS